MCSSMCHDQFLSKYTTLVHFLIKLGRFQRLKIWVFRKNSIEPFLRNWPIVVFLRDSKNKLMVFDTLFTQI